jgi:hypothetical protein
MFIDFAVHDTELDMRLLCENNPSTNEMSKAATCTTFIVSAPGICFPPDSLAARCATTPVTTIIGTLPYACQQSKHDIVMLLTMLNKLARRVLNNWLKNSWLHTTNVKCNMILGEVPRQFQGS